MRIFFTLFIFITCSTTNIYSQINMSANGSHNQEFNTLVTSGSGTWTDNSTIANWYSQRSGSGTTITANAGSSNAGDLYSYGTGTDSERALGSLGSGNAAAGNFAHGVLLRNISGEVISDIRVTYTLEQWRKGGGTTANDLTVWYKISSSTITELNPNANVTWTQISALTLSSPINTTTGAALDGNNMANKVTATNISIPGLALNSNDYIMLKWEDPDHSGTDHGLAIDDVTITWTLPVMPVDFINFNIKNNTLNFSTASETNNDYFTIERSRDGRSFDAIGKITGAGNSSKEIHYSFTDEKPLSGINYYRIKQTDFDGKYSFSEIRSVRMSGIRNITVTPRTTDGRLEVNTELEDYSIAVYNAAGQEVKMFSALSSDQYLHIDELKAGLYFLRVVSGADIETIRVVKL